MKKIYLSLILVAGMGCLTQSCSDFLDREPLTQPNNLTFLSGEEQVRNYVNGLYIALPSFPTYGMGVRGEEKNSDNILAEVYDRRMNGEYTRSEADAYTVWQTGYHNLRNVNYFFHYYQVPKAEENDDTRSLQGEVYFLRAFWHYYLLRNFGSIPVMDGFWDANATIEGLQIPQKDRGDVAQFILDDLETAKGLLYPRNKYSGLRICKEAAMMLAMDVALYEGTWEKYHKNDAFAAATDRSAYFLQKVMDWGNLLMAQGLYLNTKDKDPFGCKSDGDAFAHLFNEKDYSNVPEAIFWRKYSVADGVFHSVTPNLASGMTDSQGAAGVAKELVDTYLKKDGTPIDPTSADYHDFNKMFENRDPRLTETVMSSNKKFKSLSKGGKPMLVQPYAKGPDGKATNNPPALLNTSGSGNNRNITGFHIALGVDTTYVEGQSWDTGLILFRYATALLDYAEAAEELGKCTDDVLNKTLKPLRERAGVTYVKPSKTDSHFTDYGLLSPTMQEIRRERRVELALQGYRQDDLMRWKAVEKVMKNKRGRGAYLGHEGVLYQSFAPEQQADLDKLPLDHQNWLDPLVSFLPNGYQFNPERDYLLPKAPDELELNKQLKQNPGWN